jgi:hypothetical protein
MGRGWTFAIDINKKINPFLLSRDGKDFRSEYKLVQYLSIGKK